MSAETQQDILKKAAELFFRFGIRSVSIDDICHAMGISKKTFYVYYPTKDDLVKAMLNAGVENMRRVEGRWIDYPLTDFIRGFVERQQTESEKDIRRIPQLVFDLQKYYPQQFADFQLRVFDIQRELTAKVIIRGIREGFFRENLDVEMTATLFAQLHSDAISKAEDYQSKGIEMPRMARNTSDILLRGILSRKGYEAIFN